MDDIGYVQSTDDAALEDLVSQYDESEKSVVKFYRCTKGEKDELLEELLPSDFNFVRLAKQYGRGEYCIKVFVPDENSGGRLVMRINRREKYGGPVEEPKPVWSPAARAEPIDAAALGTAIAQAVVSGIVPLIHHQEAPQSRKEWLQEMMLLRDMFKSEAPSAPGMNFESLMGIFQKGIEMGQTMEAPADGPLAFFNAVRPLVEPLADLVKNAAAVKVATPAINPPALPSPAPTAAPGVSTHLPTPEASDMFGINRYTPFKQHIDALVGVFKRNPHTDPYAYAVLLLDELPDAGVDMMLNDDKLIDRLAEVNPEVNHLRPHFEALLLGVRELVVPEPESVMPDPELSGINSTLTIEPGESSLSPHVPPKQ